MIRIQWYSCSKSKGSPTNNFSKNKNGHISTILTRAKTSGDSAARAAATADAHAHAVVSTSVTGIFITADAKGGVASNLVSLSDSCAQSDDNSDLVDHFISERLNL